MAKPHFKLKTANGAVTLKPADLTVHLAVAQRFWGIGGFGGYLPNPDPVLKKLGRDISVYRELLSDPIVAGHVRRRKSAVAGMEWRIEANGAPDTVCDTIDKLFSGFDLYRLINQILDATLYGYQPLEIIWQRGSLWLPSEIVAKPQEWFQFAKRSDCDDTACFEIGKGGTVQLIHDFASPGWEQRQEFPDCWTWLAQAVNDMIEYNREGGIL